jgi:SpoVK/Ycf46/Vps4 family AAA+-type ATPase
MFNLVIPTVYRFMGYFLRFRSPSIIILDDIDVLCPRREKTNNEVEKRVVNTLLSLIDDMVESGEQVFVLAASSKPDSVDSALRRPGRLDTDIDVGVPNAKQRLQVR